MVRGYFLWLLFRFELTNHLFYVPKNLEQCWAWLNCNLYDAKEIGIIGASAICWAL
jgi:hypothetical protein